MLDPASENYSYLYYYYYYYKYNIEAQSAIGVLTGPPSETRMFSHLQLQETALASKQFTRLAGQLTSSLISKKWLADNSQD